MPVPRCQLLPFSQYFCCHYIIGSNIKKTVANYSIWPSQQGNENFWKKSCITTLKCIANAYFHREAVKWCLAERWGIFHDNFVENIWVEIFEARLFRGESPNILPTFWEGEPLRSYYVENYPTHLATVILCICQTKWLILPSDSIVNTEENEKPWNFKNSLLSNRWRPDEWLRAKVCPSPCASSI